MNQIDLKSKRTVKDTIKLLSINTKTPVTLSSSTCILGSELSTVFLHRQENTIYSETMKVLSAAPTMLKHSSTIEWDTYPEQLEQEFTMVTKCSSTNQHGKYNNDTSDQAMTTNDARKKVVLKLHENYFDALSDDDDDSIETVDTVMSIFVKGKKKKLGSNATRVADKIKGATLSTKKKDDGRKKDDAHEEDIDKLIASYQTNGSTSTTREGTSKTDDNNDEEMNNNSNQESNAGGGGQGSDSTGGGLPTGGAGDDDEDGNKRDRNEGDEPNKKVRVNEDGDEDERENEKELKEELKLHKMLEEEENKHGQHSTAKAVQLSCYIPGIKDNNSLIDQGVLDELDENLDGEMNDHHPLMKAISKFVLPMIQHNKEIKVWTSKQSYQLTGNVFDGGWSNQRFKTHFSYVLKSSQENGAVNFWVCLLIDYTCVRSLYNAKLPVMPTLKQERMFVRPHSDASLTLDTTKVGILTKQHPRHINPGVGQRQLNNLLKRAFGNNLMKSKLLIEKHNSPPINSPEDLPILQLRSHKTNPLQEPGLNIEAVNLYAPTQYRGLFRALLSAVAAEYPNWEYCDTTLMRFPAHRDLPARQLEVYKEFYKGYRVINVVNVAVDEMQRSFSDIRKLRHVRHIGSTEMTARLGKWSILVKTFIPEEELIAMDSIFKRNMSLSDRKFDREPYRRPEPIDQFSGSYLEQLQKQYAPQAAPIPTNNPWVDRQKDDARSIGTAVTTSETSEEIETMIQQFRQELQQARRESSEAKSLATAAGTTATKALRMGETATEDCKRNQSSITIEATQRRADVIKLQEETTELRKEVHIVKEHTDKSIASFQNIMADLTRSFQAELSNIGDTLKRQQEIMTQGFQNQSAGIQIESNTSNTGTVNGDITTSVTTRKRPEQSDNDMNKRAKAFVIAGTARIGGSLKSFGERLTKFTEEDDDMDRSASGTMNNTNNNNNNNNNSTTMETDLHDNDPCNRQEKNKNV